MGVTSTTIDALAAWLQAREGGPVQVVQTHISWLLLTPLHAYKLRKPVNLGFLDFEGAERRWEDGLAELRLNRRFAPRLYVGLCALTGTDTAPALEPWPEDEPAGPGVREGVVCMRRFPPGARLDELWQAGRLDAVLADALADAVVDAHERAEVVQATELAGPHEMLAFVAENLQQVEQLMGASKPSIGADERELLRRYGEWSRAEEVRLLPVMQARQQVGRVRDGHGDLHLENLCVFEGRVTLFDALEFDARLRRIDVMNDLAFLLMDLIVRGAHRVASRVRQRYLDRTGDFGGLAVLRYYLAYRAMVRYKIARLMPAGDPRSAAYLGVVRACMAPAARGLVLMHGLSGSGKTTASQQIVERLDAVRLRSDVWRDRVPQSPAAPRYAPEQVDRVYEALAQEAGRLLDAGQVVVVDATFLRRTHRDRFRALAGERGVPWQWVHCHAPHEVLAERVRQRQALGGDASQADVAVLAQQVSMQDALVAGEEGAVVSAPLGVLSAEALANLSAAMRPSVDQPGCNTLEAGATGS